MSWNFNWGELQMGLLSPSLVLNVFELEWTFDELIFPCLVGLSDDRLDGVHNSNGDDDDGDGGSKLFSKIEWMCVCVCVWNGERTCQNTEYISIDGLNEFIYVVEWTKSRIEKKSKR